MISNVFPQRCNIETDLVHLSASSDCPVALKGHNSDIWIIDLVSYLFLFLTRFETIR